MLKGLEKGARGIREICRLSIVLVSPKIMRVPTPPLTFELLFHPVLGAAVTVSLHLPKTGSFVLQGLEKEMGGRVVPTVRVSSWEYTPAGSGVPHATPVVGTGTWDREIGYRMESPIPLAR